MLPFPLQLLHLVVLFACCCVGPGFFFVRRLRWSPGETLCASVGLSLILLYLATFGIYMSNLPPYAYWGTSVVCLGLTLACSRDLVALLRRKQVRRMLAVYGLLVLEAGMLLGMIRSYSGAWWAGDWVEHYDRARFFIDHVPLDTKLIDLYLLPARPPLMNLLVGHFMANVGGAYDLFQVMMLLLNLLAVLPCLLMVRVMVKGAARRRVFPLLPLVALAASPMLMQNATYTWTKLLCAFFVLLGLWFYLAGWRKRDSRRMVAAFVSLSAGMLVHYSAAPFALFLVLHYLVAVLPRRGAGRWREAAMAAVLGGALFATWIGWSVAHYGVKATFASNTTVTSSAGQGVTGNFGKVARNIFYSIVPHPLHKHPESFALRLKQPSRAGYLRDYLFLMYQQNLLLAMGSGGALLVLYLLTRQVLGRRRETAPLRRDMPSASARGWFWALFIVFCTVVGIAAHGEMDEMGVAHVTLQPLILLGICFAACSVAALSWPVRALVLLGWLADFAFGVLLHFHLQTRVFDLLPSAGRVGIVWHPDNLSFAAAMNFVTKLSCQFTFVSDHATLSVDAVEAAAILLFLAVMVQAIRTLLLKPKRRGPARLAAATRVASPAA